MTLKRLSEFNIENTTVEFEPEREHIKDIRIYEMPAEGTSSFFFVTSSNPINVFTIRSGIEKDIYFKNKFEKDFSDHSLDEMREQIAKRDTTDKSDLLQTYMTKVRSSAISMKNFQKKEIYIMTPPFRYNKFFAKKRIITQHLLPYYRISSNEYNFAFTNYNAVYLCKLREGDTDKFGIFYPNVSNRYSLQNRFTFQFWFKPKLDSPFFNQLPSFTGSANASSMIYEPSCILHMHDNFAITIHSGSTAEDFDQNGRPRRFRVMLQILGEANNRPDSYNLSMITNDNNVFISNSKLEINKWNHVVIRFHRRFNSSVGSFVINGEADREIIRNDDFTIGTGNVLQLGSYYIGSNTGNDSLSYFFSEAASQLEGVETLINDNLKTEPDNYDHDLIMEGELHDVRIYEDYLTDEEIKNIYERSIYPRNKRLKFWLPVYFIPDGPIKKTYNGRGTYLITPFFSADIGQPREPFNIEIAFGGGGLLINNENYLMDFANNTFPRLYGNHFKPIANNTIPASAPQTMNDYFYPKTLPNDFSFDRYAEYLRKLFLIIPNDNGKHIPDFSILNKFSKERYTNDFGNTDLSLVSLRNLIKEDKKTDSVDADNETMTIEIAGGAHPTEFRTPPKRTRTIYQRTKDPDSNMIVIFDISNLYYGNYIKPGSFVLIKKYSNFGNSFHSYWNLTIRDNGSGGLYRANTADNKNAPWAKIGNIFYNEGIVVIYYPQLFPIGNTDINTWSITLTNSSIIERYRDLINFFHPDDREKEKIIIKFRGKHNIHVLLIEAIADRNKFNLSTNPNYEKHPELLRDRYKNIETDNFIYITHINVHDEDLNVIARATLGQPIVKKDDDKILFKLKFDF